VKYSTLRRAAMAMRLGLRRGGGRMASNGRACEHRWGLEMLGKHLVGRVGG